MENIEETKAPSHHCDCMCDACEQAGAGYFAHFTWKARLKRFFHRIWSWLVHAWRKWMNQDSTEIAKKIGCARF